jgi:hypothetical protein
MGIVVGLGGHFRRGRDDNRRQLTFRNSQVKNICGKACELGGQIDNGTGNSAAERNGRRARE